MVFHQNAAPATGEQIEAPFPDNAVVVDQNRLWISSNFLRLFEAGDFTLQGFMDPLGMDKRLVPSLTELIPLHPHIIADRIMGHQGRCGDQYLFHSMYPIKGS